MSDWLLLRLPRAAEPDVEWLLCDSQGLATGGPERGPLSSLAAHAAGRRVCVVVPASDVLYTHVDLPPRAGSRSLQMARYALEEQLLGDLEAQHFAIGRVSRKSTRTAVAVVSRALMDQWLQALKDAGLQPELMVAEGALLPPNTAQTLAWIDGDILKLRPQSPTADTSGSGIDRTDALLCLPAGEPEEALRAAFGEREMSSVDLDVVATESDWQRHGARYEALRPRLANMRAQILGPGPLPWLALQLGSITPLNLLQGDYEQRGTRSEIWPRWRVAIGLAALLLLLHLAERLYTLWDLQRLESGVESSLVKLGQEALPGSTPGAATVRKQVETQLLESAGRDPGMLLMAMESTAKALGGAGKLRALTLRDGNIDMQLRARDLETVERVRQALRRDGLNAELVGGGHGADAYDAHIQIKSAAPSGGRP